MLNPFYLRGKLFFPLVEIWFILYSLHSRLPQVYSENLAEELREETKKSPVGPKAG